MRHYLLWNTLTLLGTTLTGTLLWADTPVKPSQSSFSSPSSPAAAAPVKPVPVNEEVLSSYKMPEVEVEKKVVIVDYTIKAASIEVAWLQNPLTYPLHLRAEQLTGQSTIVLTGYVPNDQLREKAVSLARMTAGQIVVVDQLVVQPQMALNFDTPIETNHAYLVQDMLDKAAPGIGRSLQVAVDASGVTTVSGRVDEFADRLKIIHALQGIPGCTAIRYDLKVYAAANVPIVVVTTPVKEAPATLPESPKQPGPVIEFMPVDATVPLTDMPGFPNLIGPVSTARQPSPSLEEIERNANRAVTPATTIVQTSHQQDSDVSVKAVAQDPAVSSSFAANSYDSQANEKLIHSSLSGLLPPMTLRMTMETGIQLGTPVIVRTSFERDAANQQSIAVKSSELTKSSTVTTPVQDQDPTPVLINIMPRLAK
jgi:osmotically-inducible protein OsmY